MLKLEKVILKLCFCFFFKADEVLLSQNTCGLFRAFCISSGAQSSFLYFVAESEYSHSSLKVMMMVYGSQILILSQNGNLNISFHFHATSLS